MTSFKMGLIEETLGVLGVLGNSSKILLGPRILDPSSLLPHSQESRSPALPVLESRSPDHSLPTI